MNAIDCNHLEIAKLLRSHGATVVDVELGRKLCLYASKGKLKEIQKLVIRGADLNVSDYDGRTAMHLAVSENQVKIVKWLID